MVMILVMPLVVILVMLLVGILVGILVMLLHLASGSIHDHQAQGQELLWSHSSCPADQIIIILLMIISSLFSGWSDYHYSNNKTNNYQPYFIRTWLSSRQRWGGGVGGQAGQEDGYLWKNDNGSMFWLLWPVSWDFANCVTYSGRQVSILLKQPLTDLLWSNRTFKVQFGLKHLTNCLLRGATFIFHTTSAELWWWWWRLQRWWRW